VLVVYNDGYCFDKGSLSIHASSQNIAVWPSPRIKEPFLKNSSFPQVVFQNNILCLQKVETISQKKEVQSYKYRTTQVEGKHPVPLLTRSRVQNGVQGN
jgi:hypothetical protein